MGDGVMKIQSIDVSEVINVETESGEYRRFASDDWEKLWGFSWEPFRYCAEIEAEYQRYITTPPSLCKIACDVMNKVFPPKRRRCRTGWTTPIWTDTEAPNGVKPIITKGSCPGPIVNRKAFHKMGYARFDNRYHEIWE